MGKIFRNCIFQLILAEGRNCIFQPILGEGDKVLLWVSVGEQSSHQHWKFPRRHPPEDAEIMFLPKPTLAEEGTAGRKAKAARCRLNSTLAQCGRFPVLLVALFIYCHSSVNLSPVSSCLINPKELGYLPCRRQGKRKIGVISCKSQLTR